MADKKSKEEKDQAVQANAQAAGPGPSLEGRAEENAEAQKSEASNKEASKDVNEPGQGSPVVGGSRDEAREQRVRERENAAREEREAAAGSSNDEDYDPDNNDPDKVLEVSDSDKKEIEKEYEWRQRVQAERERHLRLYQVGKNPLEEDPADEEAAEEVRKDPVFAALGEDRTVVQNLSEGKSEEEAASIRREQKRAIGNNSQDDTLQRSNVRVADDSQSEEDPKDQTAEEVVDQIEKAGSVEEVESLSDSDDRKTVKKAADKRKKELSEG